MAIKEFKIKLRISLHYEVMIKQRNSCIRGRQAQHSVLSRSSTHVSVLAGRVNHQSLFRTTPVDPGYMYLNWDQRTAGGYQEDVKNFFPRATKI